MTQSGAEPWVLRPRLSERSRLRVGRGAVTAGRKQDAVLRVLRGAPLEIVARDFAVTAADRSGWRDAFLEAGAASLKSRARDDRDETIARLRTKVGELTIARSSAAIHSRRDRGQEASAGMPSCFIPRSSGWRLVAAAPLLRRGDRSDEHRHLDLYAPPLRNRPDLPRLGHCPGGGLPSARRGRSATDATAQAGAAGANGGH